MRSNGPVESGRGGLQYSSERSKGRRDDHRKYCRFRRYQHKRAGPPANADPDIGASGCVQAGNTQQYCADKFIANIMDQMPYCQTTHQCDAPEAMPDSERQKALESAVYAVNELLHALAQGPDAARARFDALVQKMVGGNPWATPADGRAFILLAVHWFGPPNMNAAISQALP